MPKRVGFHVIYATSEDSDHLASELGWAGPATRGWRSANNAHAPHELVLQLEGRVAVTRVQLLAHQSLISEKVEILIHDSAGVGGAPRTPSSPQYCAAGWIGLAPPSLNTDSQLAGNDTSIASSGCGGRSRELRTAALPKIPATYLRLKLSKPYEVAENKFNQVALMGVNVFGIELDSDGQEVGDASETYSPYDDLAFIMYVDPEIAQIVRLLEIRKQEAIKTERFEYARKLKAACVVLCSGGRALGALQLQKRLAAIAEQYERASRKRDSINAGRARLLQTLKINTLLEPNGMDSSNDEYSEEVSFTMDMLTQPLTSSDAPSPPIVQPPMSSKDSVGSSQLDKSDVEVRLRNVNSTFVDPIPKHDRNSLIFDDNGKLPYLNKGDTSYTPPNVDPRQNNFIEDRKEHPKHIEEIERIMSPQLKNQEFSKKNYKSNLNNQISNSENDLIDSGKSYFDRQLSQNLVFGSSGDVQFRTNSPQLRNGLNRDQMSECDPRINDGSRIANCDGSYFNSPANSISPTLQYNADICRNGESSPLSRSTVPQSASPHGGTQIPRRRNKSAGPPSTKRSGTSYEEYEERLLPALRHSHTNEFLRGCQSEAAEAPKGRLKMGERDRKQAALPILIFGDELVEKFYSRHFADKEDGLQNLKTILRCFDSKPLNPSASKTAPMNLSPNKAARAAVLLLHRALRDPVHSVYSLAADTTRIFFTEFIQGRVNAAEITRCVEKLVPELLTRSGDPAPRVHSLAMHTILTMADSPPVRSLNIIPSYLVRPLTAGTAPRLALSRLLMVEQLLLNHGIDKNSGLKGRLVAELGAGGLTHGQGAVRRAAERVLLAAYQRAPRMVRAQLPPDDPVTRRNLIYRHLFEGFDRIDKRKQEELLGINHCDDPASEKSSHYYDLASLKMNDSMITSHINTGMASSMTMSQISSSAMSVSQINTHMTSSQSGPSLMSSSMTTSMYQPKSSLKKTPSRRYTTAVGFNGVRTDAESPGYNKLRLDSAVSPKHQPKINKAAQNPRNYVLEKNWQNSIMQNGGNYCPQEEKTKQELQDKYRQFQNSHSEEAPSSYAKINGCHSDAKLSNGTKQNFPKQDLYRNKIIARNLHSNIVFDNKVSYDDEVVENGIKKLRIEENGNSEVEKPLDRIYGSPMNSLKRNKNGKTTIYRSKSGTNFPTCYDENYDSFDDSQLEIETYEYCNKNMENGGDSDDNKEHENDSHFSTPMAHDRNDMNGGDEDGQCSFCLCPVAEGAMDSHYWKSCPLLGKCPACRAPLQLKDLNTHLTGECEYSNDYRFCQRCTEAVNVENYLRHEADNDCLRTTEGFWKCPLCHNNVAANEESWRHHLTAYGNSEDACTMNPRINPVKLSNQLH